MFEIPGYLVNAKIAEGFCAEIYAGVEQATGRQIALKILHPRHVHNKAEYKRLIDEGALTVKLAQNDNIVQAYKSGMSGNLPYIVLEYVKGRSLRDIIVNKKKLTDLEILKLAKGLSRGLRAIHNAGICHKDLKPDNIMVNDVGVVKLLDFGFAENTKAFKLFGRSLDGSLPYMAPELISTKKPTPQTDIYALGCTLYECAAGICPFAGMSDGEVMAKQKDVRISAAPVSQHNPAISLLTERMILTCIQKDTAKRFKSADEILLELARNPLLRDMKDTQRVLSNTLK